MPGRKKSQSADPENAPLYHLKVSLEGIEPPIWRRLQVPGTASLGWLHAVIQVAMGWTNSHLHQFIVGKRMYSDPGFGMGEYEEDPSVFDENATAIMDIARRARSSFGYEYDFGDSWHHRIVVGKILDADPDAMTVARCLDGARACPPDDCGGVWGYADLLEAVRDPKHEEHESAMEWLGEDFDPDAFDCDAVNRHLRFLKWPRATQGQLARVLMRRDGVKA